MQRSVQPEILDGLPACNLDAAASRRDLVKINGLMGNFRWIRHQIGRSNLGRHDRLLEIGAGDGTLAKKLLRDSSPANYHALDQCGPPEGWPSPTQWHSADLLQFTGYGEYTYLLANLILHHFSDRELSKLGTRIRESGIRCIIACEPCRRSFHKAQLRAGKWIGFNYVTLNDGCVSIDAGFRADELPGLLGLDPAVWTWLIEETWMGAYRMRADKK
ncbi:MAG: hypothetical protein GVY36_09820 [Verrucomicrobia bacterium]|jgi:hypothetical protein|nr:hypothetical protein [Verrucomicrobiota bacterium]